MSAVPDLEGIVAQPLEPARQLYVHVAVDWTAEERLGGGHGEGEVAAAGDDDRLGAVLAGELPPLRLADHHGRAGLDDRELLGGDGFPRRPQHVGVLECDVRQHLDR